MKKKFLGLLLCAAMLLLSACGNSDVMVLTPYGDAIIRDEGNSSGTNTSRPGNSSDTKAETTVSGNAGTNAVNTSNSNLIHVGFAQVGSESGWRLAQTASMKSTFTEANGYQFDFVDCNNNQQTQLDTLKRFIADKVDYIVLDPIVETGYDEVLKKCQEAGIPVIVVDRNISADASLYTCWVGSNFVQEGENAAAWLETYLKANNRENEEINIVTIQGSDGASATLGRTEGFQKGASAHSNWKLLDQQSGDFTEDGGNAVMRAFLKSYSDIDVVVCQNDDEAFGAITAMKEAGLTCGPDGDIIVISFDATKAGFERMVAGEINVDVECNPLEGPLVAELIQKLKKGEKVEAIQYMEEGVYPAEEAAAVIGSRAY